MKRFLLSLSAVLLVLSLHAKIDTVTIKIVQTSDVHGAIFPYDFINDTPTKTSLAQVYTYVKEQRKAFGDNLILLDNGDNLQGQPVVYYYNFIDTLNPHILSKVMNFMRYDATSVGNHDVEVGHPVYDRIRREYNFPMLCANILKTDTGLPYFEPYKVFERNGIKIAVLGLITPHVPYWLPENLWSGMKFVDMVESAQEWVKIIQEKEKPHILLGLFHSGYKTNATADETMVENASLFVAQQVSGFDAVLVGHDHDKLCEKFVNITNDSVWVLDPSCNAQYVSELTFKLIVDNHQVISKQSNAMLVDIANIQLSNDFDKFNKQFDEVKQFVSKPIGQFTKTITTRDAYFGPSAFVDLIHQVQLDVTKADISFAAPLSFDTEIKKGTVYVRDMFKLYKFENMLYTIELTGKEIKNYLEFSYGLWLNQMKKPTDHLLLVHQDGTKSNRNGWLINPSYNFDSAAGIIYEVDVTKPVGERIIIEKMANNLPFLLDKKYKVAVNSYRGNGGGDHITKGVGIAKENIKDRIVSSTDIDLRYYLMKWIERHNIINPSPLNEWKIIPENWVKTASKRDYELLFDNSK